MRPSLQTKQEAPAGWYYFDNVLTTADQMRFIEACLRLPMAPVLGPFDQPSRRHKASFGFEYISKVRKPLKAPAIPAFLLPLREKCLAVCAAHDILVQETLNQCSVQMYPPGAGIGVHRDSPLFGATILGVSLGGQATMRLRHHTTGTRYDVTLQPGSLLVMQGAARWEWSHDIPGTSVTQTRWSVTWRHYDADKGGKGSRCL